MNVSTLLENDDFKLIAGQISKEITGVYSCDLLSWVMSHAKEGNAWLTVQTHVNIIAVAVLLELSCIIILEDAEIDSDTIKKANEENIPLIHTSKNAFEIIKSYFC